MINWIAEPLRDKLTGALLDPGTVRCRCGKKHDLAWHSDSACDSCGVEFNCNGQQLAPRLQWEDS